MHTIIHSTRSNSFWILYLHLLIRKSFELFNEKTILFIHIVFICFFHGIVYPHISKQYLNISRKISMSLYNKFLKCLWCKFLDCHLQDPYHDLIFMIKNVLHPKYTFNLAQMSKLLMVIKKSVINLLVTC
jgi:hypothetical protein